MKKILKSILSLTLALSFLTGCASQTEDYTTDDSTETVVENQTTNTDETINEDGTYTSKEDVSLYIYTYNHLPSNYITKKEAKALGWDSSSGNLWDVADGMSIGGDYFGNYEELLPTDTDYHECDIDYTGGYRNSKRLIYGEDGSIYYTEDHYTTFEELY